MPTKRAEQGKESERDRLRHLAEEANEPAGPPDLASAAPRRPGRELAHTFGKRGKA